MLKASQLVHIAAHRTAGGSGDVWITTPGAVMGAAESGLRLPRS